MSARVLVAIVLLAAAACDLPGRRTFGLPCGDVPACADGDVCVGGICAPPGYRDLVDDLDGGAPVDDAGAPDDDAGFSVDDAGSPDDDAGVVDAGPRPGTCATPFVAAEGSNFGDTRDGVDEQQGACGQTNGPEHAWQYTKAGAGSVTVEVQVPDGGFMGFYGRTVCDDPAQQFSCQADIFPGEPFVVTFDAADWPQGDTRWLLVEAFYGEADGPYTLVITETP